MTKPEFSWRNLQTGEKWWFANLTDLQAFLDARAGRRTLAGSGEPQELVVADPPENDPEAKWYHPA